jgi:hypothetical protein
MKWLTSSKIIFFLLFCFITKTSDAQQIKQFSNDRKTFEKELKSFFQNDKDDETQKTVNDFLLMVTNNSYSDAEFNVIIKTLNTLLSKHYRQPHFLNYLQCLNAYKEKNLEQKKFNQYHKAIEKLTKESKKKFEDFGRIIHALFSYKAIYSDKSKTWLIGDNDYDIIYEDFPVIQVHGKLNLTCYSPGDTIKIINTSGTFYPFSTKWVGEGGRIDWRRVMLDTNTVYALLNTYNIDISKTEILADSVRFFHKAIFNYPLIGEIHDKAMSAYRGANSAYPVFRSYDAVHIHARLAVHTVYIGGFSMQGRKIIGSSNAQRKAKLIILYKGIRTLIAESDIFDISPEKIVASDAATTIYFSEDSFYHPKLIFDYQIKEKTVTLTRGREGLYRSPMINTYHKLEMEFDQIKWTISEPTMSITLLKGSQGSAMFASQDFFLQGIYMGYQGILSYHPIEKIKRYCEKYNTRRFNITEYAVYNQSKPENLQPLMIRLAMGGFIFYNIQTGMIDVQEKTFLYVNADKGRQDYDMIRFESITPQKDNAKFSLNTGNLVIE